MIDATLTGDGQTSAASSYSEIVAITATNDFGGGTLVIQARPKGTSHTAWAPVSGASWTAAVAAVVNVSRHWDLRFSLSGATNPDLDLTMHPVSK
jgi:hypothetical protein